MENILIFFSPPPFHSFLYFSSRSLLSISLVIDEHHRCLLLVVFFSFVFVSWILSIDVCKKSLVCNRRRILLASPLAPSLQTTFRSRHRRSQNDHHRHRRSTCLLFLKHFFVFFLCDTLCTFPSSSSFSYGEEISDAEHKRMAREPTVPVQASSTGAYKTME